MKKKHKKKIGGIISWLVFAIIVLSLVFLIIVQTATPTSGVDIVGFKSYLVADTRSMEPELKANDFIIIVKKDFKDLKEGDYITYLGEVNDKKVPITHAVIEIITDGSGNNIALKTKGINDSVAPTADPLLTTVNGDDYNGSKTNQYIGAYAFTVPLFGYVVMFMQNPFGLAATIAAILLIFTLIFLIKRSKKSKKLKAKAELEYELASLRAEIQKKSGIDEYDN